MKDFTAITDVFGHKAIFATYSIACADVQDSNLVVITSCSKSQFRFETPEDAMTAIDMIAEGLTVISAATISRHQQAAKEAK